MSLQTEKVASISDPQSPKTTEKRAVRNSKQSKKVRTQQYVEHTATTQHSRYKKIANEQEWRNFWELHCGGRCPYCLELLRRYPKEGSLKGDRMHIIAQAWGAPESCDWDNLIFGCDVCNGQKEGMGTRNALAFALTKGRDKFVALSKQVFLLHIGHLERTELNGWSWQDQLDCYEFIMQRFVNFPFGWEEEERQKASTFLNEDLRTGGLGKKWTELVEQKKRVENQQAQLEEQQSDLKGQYRELEDQIAQVEAQLHPKET